MTQSAAVTATNLVLQGTGATYTLTNGANSIGTLVTSDTTGTASLYDSISVAIGSVAGININGVTEGTLNLSFAGGQGVTQSQPITVANLSLSGSGGTYMLTSLSNSVGAFTANDSTGTLSLYDTGTVTQSAAITLANLALLGSGANYSLTTSSNTIGTLAANTGSVSLTDATSLIVGTVGTTSGITTTPTTGSLTLNVTGTISDPTAPISVGTFDLAGGNWVQNIASPATLPSFAAYNFEITGGTFLRLTGGAGTIGSPYQLVDIYGLQGVEGFLTSSFQIQNNIDATGTANWNNGAGFVPIGNVSTFYSGTFNGQDGLGFTINGLTINEPNNSQVALFGVVTGTIKNVALTNVNITGSFNVAGLVGEVGAGATVTNSSVSGAVAGTGQVDNGGGTAILGFGGEQVAPCRRQQRHHYAVVLDRDSIRHRVRRGPCRVQ